MRKYQLTFPVKAIFPPVSENLLSEVSMRFCKAIVFPRSVYGLPADNGTAYRAWSRML